MLSQNQKRLGIWLVVIFGFVPESHGQSLPDFPVIDAHAHFFQIPASAVIKTMDEHQVNLAVVMPVPNAGAGRGRNAGRKRAATDDFYLAAAKAYPRRLIAFYGGNMLNQILMTTESSSLTNRDRELFRKEVEEELKDGGYKGIGELGPRHIAWRPGMREIRYPADHPLMFDLADLAGQYKISMDIHLEATEESIVQFERLLAYNPKAKITWSHAGWSNTGLATPESIKKLMSQHPNLYSSIKYRRAAGEAGQKVSLLDSRGALLTNWKSLFEEFQDRFLIGTDVKLGDEEKDYQIVASHRAILRQLSGTAAEKIAWKNAAKLLHLKELPHATSK